VSKPEVKLCGTCRWVSFDDGGWPKTDCQNKDVAESINLSTCVEEGYLACCLYEERKEKKKKKDFHYLRDLPVPTVGERFGKEDKS
jgi:hypothetical protein